MYFRNAHTLSNWELENRVITGNLATFGKEKGVRQYSQADEMARVRDWAAAETIPNNEETK